MTQEHHILLDNVNNAGVITLNNPESMNSLDLLIINSILVKIQEWERCKTCVIIKAAAGRAFCVGGNLKMGVQSESRTQQFLFWLYTTNFVIGKFKIPYIALMNGMAMGGGLGLSVHGRYRVATEVTVVAMPETRIGLVPDIGATYFLPRLDNHLGFYMGLTGFRLKGKDVVCAGIATHFVRTSRLLALESQLTHCSTEAEIRACLKEFQEPPGEFSLAGDLKNIDYCFSAETVEEIIRRLEEVDNEWAKETLKRLSLMCPTSLKVALRALTLGQRQSLRQCLRLEHRITYRGIQHYNFKEGCRARIIDKDNKPQWKPATLAEVTEEEVQSYFQRLPEDMELKFTNSKL